MIVQLIIIIIIIIIIIVIIIIVVVVIIIIIIKQQTGHAGTNKNIARKLPGMRQFEEREEDGKNNIKIHSGKMCGRNSVLGIATGFQLHGLGFETPVGRGACPTRPDRPPMRTQTPVR